MLEGIDVSDVQGTVDWKKVKAHGIEFAFCKATEGETIIAKTFKRNWEGIKSAGLIRGAYHFGRTKNDPIKEAEHFINVVGSIENGDMLVLDMEDSKSILTSDAFFTWNLEFLKHVEKLTNTIPILYTYGPYFDTHGRTPSKQWVDNLSRFPLWLAAYVTSPDNYVPKVWKDVGWTIWQRSGDICAKGDTLLHVPGINCVVDRNQYRGTSEQLEEFAKKLHKSTNISDMLPIDINLQKDVVVIDPAADDPLKVPANFWDTLLQFIQKLFGIK